MARQIHFPEERLTQSSVAAATIPSVHTIAHQTPEIPIQTGNKYNRTLLIATPRRIVRTQEVTVRMTA